MNKYTHINHDTFQEDRNNGIGASDFAILCLESNFMTPRDLWAIKTEQEKQEISDELQKLFTAGNEQEPVTLWRFLKSVNEKDADKIFETHLNQSTVTTANSKLFTRFQHNDYMFAHPDMIYFDGKKNINVEGKFVKYKGEWDFKDLTEQGLPFKVYLQVQYQMMCTGLNETIVCANYQGAENFYFPVKANKKFYPKIEKICADFWGLVKRKEPPMPESRKDWKKMFPNRNFKSIILPEELEMETIMMKDRFAYVKQRIKQLETEKDKIKNSVMASMTQNNLIQTADGEQIAKITCWDEEKVLKLSTIKKEHKRIYKYLLKNDMINITEKTRLTF
jgi:predicted phage-related endonuclease